MKVIHFFDITVIRQPVGAVHGVDFRRLHRVKSRTQKLASSVEDTGQEHLMYLQRTSEEKEGLRLGDRGGQRAPDRKEASGDGSGDTRQKGAKMVMEGRRKDSSSLCVA
ncbi:hypothetical protein SAY87_017571 [Trapa incisa]|uniref:Uncharacterized protein n=1 Tax=Trapa incisa TaxID=236973 RepID=A0AAN7L407_9MYRT|nr:hypothetical protein SAY87_017571 [Trapa incisa]